VIHEANEYSQTAKRLPFMNTSSEFREDDGDDEEHQDRDNSNSYNPICSHPAPNISI
jgi:hypothetical protein